MKTEKEIEVFRKDIEQRLIDVSKLSDPIGAIEILSRCTPYT